MNGKPNQTFKGIGNLLTYIGIAVLIVGSAFGVVFLGGIAMGLDVATAILV